MRQVGSEVVEMAHQIALDERIYCVGMVAIGGMKYAVDVGVELGRVHRRPADANDLEGCIFQGSASDEIVECRDQFDLGQITRETENDEGETIHRGSVAHVVFSEAKGG